MPSSSENLKNLSGDLTLTLTITLTRIIAEVFKGFLFSEKTGPRGLAADARLQTQTCLHDADGELQAHPSHTRMLYRKDVFEVFVYISIFGVRTKIFRNLTKIIFNNGIQRNRVIKLYLTLSKSKYNNLVSAFSSSFERGEKPCL